MTFLGWSCITRGESQSLGKWTWSGIWKSDYFDFTVHTWHLNFQFEYGTRRECEALTHGFFCDWVCRLLIMSLEYSQFSHIVQLQEGQCHTGCAGIAQMILFTQGGRVGYKFSVHLQLKPSWSDSNRRYESDCTHAKQHLGTYPCSEGS